jgi:hypothetical protein
MADALQAGKAEKNLSLGVFPEVSSNVLVRSETKRGDYSPTASIQTFSGSRQNTKDEPRSYKHSKPSRAYRAAPGADLCNTFDFAEDMHQRFDLGRTLPIRRSLSLSTMS